MAILLCVALLGGCDSAPQPPERLSVRQLANLYNDYPIEITQRVYIEGVVVSSDRYGEFRNRVFIEDSTGGIAVLVDSDHLHEEHRMGERLRVEVLGLTLGGYAGSLRLGTQGVHYEVEPLSMARWREIYRLVGVAEQLPLTRVRVGELSALNLSTRLLLESVRFVEEGEPWAPRGENTSRHLVDHNQPSDTLIVRMAGNSDFADSTIPSGECSVVGVLDYFYDSYQLLLFSPEDVLSHSEN